MLVLYWQRSFVSNSVGKKAGLHYCQYYSTITSSTRLVVAAALPGSIRRHLLPGRSVLLPHSAKSTGSSAPLFSGVLAFDPTTIVIQEYCISTLARTRLIILYEVGASMKTSNREELR